MEIVCCGSSDWLDRETVKEELNRIKYSYNSHITLLHRGNKGSDRLVNWMGRDLGFKVVSNDKPISNNTDLLVVFQKNGSRENESLLSLAKEKSIPIRVVRGY